jgi:hypothetical protein
VRIESREGAGTTVRLLFPAADTASLTRPLLPAAPASPA